MIDWGIMKQIKDMDYSRKYTHNDKQIYISYESKHYILCSYKENGKGLFKLDKTEFHG